ncbi:hypothetical protein ASF49_05030 [Methylobacterium sp. Leaf104]|uniref:hypothetical protein n=1 Tax=Methylobacterium TaxID=407 RepID=UPI0006F7734E|nr:MULTISPECIES: hypothetical protein [Methylobacterium]KQP38367.1 hypothetical protein ASF49_05030 [Methylobacterium sp. Leaf104]MCI9880228.1 hypothetical protein [Methylobacterium goesingense]
MGRHPVVAMFALCASVALAAPSRAQSPQPATGVNDWAAFRAALASCWIVPMETRGSSIALRFGLDKTGRLRGRPLVTARQLTGDRETRTRFEAAAFDALARCLPMAVTPAFGAILGESPVRLRLANTPPEPAYQINSNITLFAPQ